MQTSNHNFIKTQKQFHHHATHFDDKNDYVYYQEHSNKKQKNHIQSERKKKIDRIHTTK